MVVFDPTPYSYHQNKWTKYYLLYFEYFQLRFRFWITINKIYYEIYVVINGHVKFNIYKAVENDGSTKNFSQIEMLIDKSWRYNTRQEKQLVNLY